MSDFNVELYGASDDLIEIEGAIIEEFNVSRPEALIATSSGELIEIKMSNVDGFWHASVLRASQDVPAQVVSAPDADDHVLAKVDASSGWVALVKHVELARKR